MYSLLCIFVAYLLQASVSRVLLIVWQLAQPLLFGLIGAAVDLDFITPSLVGKWARMYVCVYVSYEAVIPVRAYVCAIVTFRLDQVNFLFLILLELKNVCRCMRAKIRNTYHKRSRTSASSSSLPCPLNHIP